MQLNSYTQIKEVMDKFNIAPNKKFGQNFLLDNNVLNKIANSCNLDKTKSVLEVGPGMGALTDRLCTRAKNVVSIEIDRGMIPVLNYTLGEYDNFDIVNGDVLDKNIREEAFSKLTKPFSVCANLPYYITTPIIMSFLEECNDVDTMVLMMQKEVAERICASPATKDYGILTLAIQYYADCELLFTVSPQSFYPKPNVTSIVIRLTKLDKPRVEVKDRDLLFKVIRSSFNMRRKTIINNLSSSFSLDKATISEILQKSNIDEKRRGETLSLDEFAVLSDNFYEILHKSID